MQELRSQDDLKAARRALFEAFPHSAGCDELLEFQCRLIDEIRRSESERNESSDVRDHLHRVRSYGDALAFECLSVYALRQLRRNHGKPPNISGQGAAFDLVRSCCEVINQNGVKAIICDLTNVLKTGDIVGCVHPDMPQIFECKASPRKNPRFERQGRRGRQLSRMESIQKFLISGEGKFFMDERYRRTITVKSEPKFNFGIVNDVVNKALAGAPVVAVINEFQMYVAVAEGEPDYREAFRSWKVVPGERVVVAGASEPLMGGWADVRPPVLWDISPAARWALMEGDVSLLHVVRANALVGISRGDVLVEAAVDRPADSPADLPWGYQIRIGQAMEAAFISPNACLQLAYGHETLESARERLLETAEYIVSAHVGMTSETDDHEPPANL